jgi:hypothetical protein
MQSKRKDSIVDGVLVTRSSVKRLEREVQALRLQLEEINAKRIQTGDDRQAGLIKELRSTIDMKENLILRIKLML